MDRIDWCLLRAVLSGNRGAFGVLHLAVLDTFRPPGCELSCAILPRIAQWYIPFRGGGVNKVGVGNRLSPRGCDIYSMYRQ